MSMVNMDENYLLPRILEGSITNITFGIATTKEIRTSSANESPVSHHAQLMNPFLGLPLESGKCESCGTTEQGQCEGHFGFIELPSPIFHPRHVNELKNLLNLVCLKCLRMKRGKARNALNKERAAPDASCRYCRDLPPVSVGTRIQDGAICLELKVPSRTKLKDHFWSFLNKYGFQHGDSLCRPLLPMEVQNILKCLPDDTKTRLSGKGHFPQNGFIMHCLPVPPNCLYVPEVSDGKCTVANDLSIPMLRKVLTKIEVIKRSRSGSPNFESQEIESNELQIAIAQYLDLRGTKKTLNDNAKMLPGAAEASNSSAKQWLEKMRSLFISKGSGFSSRCVITGDAYRSVNEIGIPLEIAKKITFEERVTAWNLKHLQELVDNRQCLRYGVGPFTYSTEEGSKGHTFLKIGQVVSRRIMDGDIVFVNRPPTTHKHALQAFSVYVHDENTVKINPIICAPFGADFDGDCVHIFYPQSLSAKAEVRELFSVEQQLCSSHSGAINIQFVNDSLLALKRMHRSPFLTKSTAQQLAMLISRMLPTPALLKSLTSETSGPLWTVLQIVQTTLPLLFDCHGEGHLIIKSKILKFDLSRDNVQSLFTHIATTILASKGPKEALMFFNLLQPLLMEFLFLEGFSINLRDFYVAKDIETHIKDNVQEISHALHQLRLSYNELLDLQVERDLKRAKAPVVNFLLKSSSLGELLDTKSEASIAKVVQQIGFVGLQVSDRGKLYSMSLVQDLFSHYVDKYSVEGASHSAEAYGLIKSSFFDGLTPYEELLHSISCREVIIRSSRGLAEPGTLFKNLMAILRDVTICYDGTVRNVCSNSIVQFEYAMAGSMKSLNISPPGEPVGVLAATAISNPAYKAVLDSSQSTNSSWELMKEVLLTKVNFNNDVKSRRVILYVEDTFDGRYFCKEKSACIVQNHLKKVYLKDCVIDFSIKYENQSADYDGSEMLAGLFCHIHLDKARLHGLDAADILQKCQECITRHSKKKSPVPNPFKHVSISLSECCRDAEMCQSTCLQFSKVDSSANSDDESIVRTIHEMTNIICPALFDTILKGDPRIYSANIIWIDSTSTCWVKNSRKAFKGEVVLEVQVEKDYVKGNDDAWRITLDSCLSVMHFIDTKRSITSGIQQIQSCLGISCAFDQSVQRLSTAIKMVSKGVLMEHLMLVALSMTCTGKLIGFNTSGYRALFHSLNVQVPFTEATLITPMKCFEKAAQKCHKDSLSGVVASSLWGKSIAIGTGTHFQIFWDRCQMDQENISKDVYEFLHVLRSNDGEVESTACLGVDIDDIMDDDGELSPIHDYGPTFDENDQINGHLGKGSVSENESQGNSNWENVPVSVVQADGWEKFTGASAFSNDGEAVAFSTARSDGWEKFAAPISKSNDWNEVAISAVESDAWEKPAATAQKSNCWGDDTLSAVAPNSWENPTSSSMRSESWDKVTVSISKSDGWQNNKASAPKSGSSSADHVETQEAPLYQWTNDPEKGSRWERSAFISGPDLNEAWDNKKQPEKNNYSYKPKAKPNEFQRGTAEKAEYHDAHSSELSRKAKISTQGALYDASELSCDPAKNVDWKNEQAECKAERWGKNTNQNPKLSITNSTTDVWNIQSSSENFKSVQDVDRWNNERGKSQKNQHALFSVSSGDAGWSAHDTSHDKTDDAGWNNETQTGWKAESSWRKNVNKTSESGAWNGQSSTDDIKSTQNIDRWNDDRGQSQQKQLTRSQGWGSSRTGEARNQHMPSDQRKTWNPVGGLTATGRRLDSFTCEEAEILKNVDQIMHRIKKILHQSSYSDGDRLSEEDQKYILDEVFNFHPARESKISGCIDHVKVDRHENFGNTRCFFVVSNDGASTDFSYLKCMQNFIKCNYENAECFSKKYFRQRRPDSATNEKIDLLTTEKIEPPAVNNSQTPPT